MEMRADPRTGSEFTSAELRTYHPVDAAIPRTEITVGEHAVGKFVAQLQQARPVCRLRQWRPRSDRLPAREKNWREAVEFDPERALAACRKIKLRGDGRGNAELRRASVLRNVQIPRQRTPNRWIVPNCQLGQVAHGPAPWIYLYSGGAGVHLDTYREAPVACPSGVRATSTDCDNVAPQMLGVAAPASSLNSHRSSERQPNPGRGSTYRRGNSVQTTAPASSALLSVGPLCDRSN